MQSDVAYALSYYIIKDTEITTQTLMSDNIKPYMFKLHPHLA